MNIVDLRSDTVTHPTAAMRQAMANAEVGDDVMGEDPTINRLQEMAAERMGKEAGLFVPSGTMGNLVAILTHCGRGDEVIMGHLGHTFLFEGGGPSTLGGISIHTVPNQVDGTLLLEDLEAAVRPEDVHQPVSRLVVLENTQNRCGGAVLTAEYTNQVGEFVRQQGLKLHIDGARIFNAAVALGVKASDLSASADSVTFCLSKGLCAPVGSVLCGSDEFIYRARRMRKHLGGGMRQAGVLAAAGIVALEQMVDRLAEDHRRARMLAAGLLKIPGIEVDTPTPASNMVFANIMKNVPITANELLMQLRDNGVKVGVVNSHRLRMVTHYWIDDTGIEQTIQAIGKSL
jgi:threonine aldolase